MSMVVQYSTKVFACLGSVAATISQHQNDGERMFTAQSNPGKKHALLFQIPALSPFVLEFLSRM